MHRECVSLAALFINYTAFFFLTNLFIQRTKYTPEILFQANGKLRIVGFSIPENTLDVYAQPLDWLRALKKTDPMPIELDLKFDFLDSSSIRSVADMVKILNSLGEHKVKVNWFYEKEDEDMREMGDDLSNLSKVEFNLIEMDVDDLNY